MEDRLAAALVVVAVVLTGVGLFEQRSRRDRHGRAFAAFGIAALILGLLLATLRYLSPDYGWLAGVLAVACLTLGVLFTGVLWAWRNLAGPTRVAGLAWVLAFCAVLTLGPFQSRTLRLAVGASRPALDRIAERVRSGETVEVPVRAGLFLVRELQFEDEPSSGTAVGLVLHDRYGGDTALVHFPEGNRGRADDTGDERLAYYGPLFNLNLDLPLGGGWRYQFED